MQIPHFWLVVALYFVAWLLLLLGIVFEKSAFRAFGTRICQINAVIHGCWILVRWIEAGHGPYLNLYEVASSDAIVAILLYLLVRWRYPKLDPIGILLLPVAFLLMGFGAMSARQPVSMLPILDSSWLVVHVVTAKLAFGSYLISGILAMVYLRKAKGTTNRIINRFPANPVIEELIRKFVTLGFLNHTVMLVSGSIWANVAFGAYWSWDPIETWSLISWLIYGIFYHMITIHGFKGPMVARVCLLAFASIIFALFGVPFIFVGSHNMFL